MVQRAARALGLGDEPSLLLLRFWPPVQADPFQCSCHQRPASPMFSLEGSSGLPTSLS